MSSSGFVMIQGMDDTEVVPPMWPGSMTPDGIDQASNKDGYNRSQVGDLRHDGSELGPRRPRRG